MSTMTGTLFSVLTTRDDRYGSAATQGAAVVLMAGLTAAAAQISVPLPFTSVPFTFQPMIVLLGGLALGSRLGASAQALYLLLGIAGLPVFATSPLLPQGALRLLGPTGGYLLSYPLAAFVVGRLAERGFDRRYVGSVVAMLIGLLVVYVGGVSMLTALAQGTSSTGLAVRQAVAMGVVPFVAADVVKVLLAAGVLPAVWRLIGTQR